MLVIVFGSLGEEDLGNRALGSLVVVCSCAAGAGSVHELEEADLYLKSSKLQYCSAAK